MIYTNYFLNIINTTSIVEKLMEYKDTAYTKCVTKNKL